jgi:hypothetical protein
MGATKHWRKVNTGLWPAVMRPPCIAIRQQLITSVLNAILIALALLALNIRELK